MFLSGLVCALLASQEKTASAASLDQLGADPTSLDDDSVFAQESPPRVN